MPNRLESLSDGRADVLVVGGGIHGLFAAYDAAARGLSVILVDQADVGSGLSFNHQRTLHGGLRELQRCQLRKVREQIRERRTWARIAPHLLRPLPFLVGSYGWGTSSRSAVRVGLKAYDLLSRKRNAGVSTELHLPKGRLESAAATRRLSQGVSGARLSGGAIYYDYQTTHPDRLTWTVALAARNAGARLVNYVEATGPLLEHGHVAGATVRDVLTGETRDLHARVTLLAVGSAAAAVGAAFGVGGAPPLLRAMNLLLNRPARDIATASRGRSGRMLTAVPWRGYVLVGTHQSDGLVEAGETQPPASAIDAALEDLNYAFSQLKATRDDIRMVHHGLVPARTTGGLAELLTEPVILTPAQRADRGSDRLAPARAGVVSLIGVKYTGARLAAERAVDAVVSEIGGGRRRARTAAHVLPHADIADVEGRLVETLREIGVSLDRDQIEHLGSWYGTEASDVVRFAFERGLMRRLADGEAVLAGEIAYAVEHAQAVRLADVVLRRTPLGSAGHPADVMGERLGWTPEQRAAEIQDVLQRYPAPAARPAAAAAG
jgi:glycerol-3-phosphate dehydrogenase